MNIIMKGGRYIPLWQLKSTFDGHSLGLELAAQPDDFALFLRYDDPSNYIPSGNQTWLEHHHL